MVNQSEIWVVQKKIGENWENREVKFSRERMLHFITNFMAPYAEFRIVPFVADETRAEYSEGS